MESDKECPCEETCCEKPITTNPSHICDEEDFCEKCYITECLSCHSSCYCRL